MPDIAAARLAACIDIGGTSTRVALVDSLWRIRERTRMPTAARQDQGLREIDAAVRNLAARQPTLQIAGIGVAVPGLVDSVRGIAHAPANLPGWQDVALKAHFADSFGLLVTVGNDANLAAVAESVMGAGQGEPDMVYVTISTGIGGGIIAGGKLVVGAAGYAGEIGHQTIDMNGPPCACGQRGCLETLASGTAMARIARAAIAAGEPSSLRGLADIRAETIAAAAAHGDRLANRIIEQTGVYIGIGLANLVHILNPRLFVLGGGVSAIGEPLFVAVRRALAERSLPIMGRSVQIVPARLGDDAGLLGAAVQVFDQET